MSKDEPFVVLFSADAEIRPALKRRGWDVVTVKSVSRLVGSDYRRPPRLFLIHAGELGEDRIAALLVSLHRERPLTDVVIWAPAADGNLVRRCFHAGAKDVVVSNATDDLAMAAQKCLDRQVLLPRINKLSRQRSRSSRFDTMFSRSEAMWDLFDLCLRIASTDATVLIVGETGTGKELLARAIHRYSNRSGRFVAANCAAIPRDLIDSELFGHAKGAFTGAHREKTGLVTHSHEGTLFLDEIGDMPLEGQQSLLRMLQERKIRPVGSLVETDVDVRVVAATHVPLDSAIKAGDFREDLFYRLDVIRMNVPPLRERPEDIVFLFGYFNRKQAEQYGVKPPELTTSFLDALSSYDWPGNVRQLENFSERLVLTRRSRPLVAADFHRLHRHSTTQPQPAATSPATMASPAVCDPTVTLEENIEPTLRKLEESYLRAVLQETNGRVAEAARHAGVSRRTLLRKMKGYGIDKRKFKRS